MILYFADKLYSVLGLASTSLPNGFRIKDDVWSKEIGTGFDTFEYTIAYPHGSRVEAERIMKCGNYIFRSNEDGGYYTAAVIIECNTDPKNALITLYAEDVGLDLLNGLAPATAANKNYSISHYVQAFIQDTGYDIGINEFSEDNVLRLGWDSESTITERLLDIAKNFNAEIYCTFDVDGYWIRRRHVNIVYARGGDTDIELREGRELSNVTIKRNMSNVATALYPVGAKPEGSIGAASYEDSQGRQHYTWVKFADTTGGVNMEDSGRDKKYIGMAINQLKQEESTYPSAYKWRRINYTDTIITYANNTNGFLEVKEDPNDENRYTWVSFATKEDGTGCDGNSSNKTYIGISTGQESNTERPAAADHDWYDMREATSDRRVILLPANTNGVVPCSEGNIWVAFSNSADGSGMSRNAANKKYTGLAFYRPSDDSSYNVASNYVWLENETITADGGLTVTGTANGGVRIPVTGRPNNYVWYMFSDLEEPGPNPDSGSYIGLSYDHSVASPMSTNADDYDWHEMTGDEAQGINLKGYKYDDGDFYVDGVLLKSREALKEWARDVSTANTNFGHIIRSFECDADSQKELFKAAMKELKARRNLEVTYEAEVTNFPRNVRIGDKVRIVDREGELYLKARVLKLAISVTANTYSATFGDYVVLTSGVSGQLSKLANDIRIRNKEIDASNAYIIKAVTTYFLTTDTADIPSVTDPNWTTIAIDQKVGQHVWQMSETTYADGHKMYSTPTEVTTIATAMRVYTLYFKSTTDSAPTVPDTADQIPPIGWSLEEPVYDPENPGELYSVTLTTYSDGHFTYSDVYKVSTYSQVQSANKSIQEAKDAAEEAKDAAEEAKDHADEVFEAYSEEVGTTLGKVTAALSEKGFTVNNDAELTQTTLDSKGLRIERKSDGVIIAQFDNDNSYVDYLKVNRYLSFGAHRVEKKSGAEYDNTTIEGTAFFWTGGE